MESVSCELQYSGAAVAFLLAATVATWAVLALLPAPGLARASAALLVAALAARALREHLQARALRLHHSRAMHVRDASGAWTSGTFRNGCRVWTALVVLRWRPDGARRDRTLVLLPGMVGSDDLRKIRVILRWA